MSSGQDDSGNDVNDDTPGSGGGNKSFKFTIVDGKVTEVFEVKDGVEEPKPIDDDGSETYTVESGEVVRTDITTVPLTFKVETSEYERGDSGYADHLAIKPSSHVFQIN